MLLVFIHEFCFCGIAIFDVIYMKFISSESRWIPLGILFREISVREISAKQICNAHEVR